jgi:hypothetical protein
MPDLKDFWPSAANCQECLITEAETASEAVFLAIHQPMKLSRRLIGSQESEEKREQDLLEALLTNDLPSGTLLAPILGNSGVGKSHMIRWLDAHLRLREDGVKRHIVRIPKSANLRRVLELILEGLPDERYGELRRQLLGAQMPPDSEEATHVLRERLVLALQQHGRQAKRRCKGQRPEDLDREREAFCSDGVLPALLEDPELKKHFMSRDPEAPGVLARLTGRAMAGAFKQGSDGNQFSEQDLTFTQYPAVSRGQLTALSDCLIGRITARLP